MIGRCEWPALGTTATVLTTDPAGLDLAVEVVQDVVENFDAVCSRFRADSELMNLQPGADRRVSRTLVAALGAALTAARTTDGLVDPTVGAALIRLGYDRDYRELGSESCRSTVRLEAGRPADWRSIIFDERQGTVRVPPGVVVDVGATGKALAADVAAQRAAGAVRCGVLVNLGGDIAIAGDPPHSGWPIGIAGSHRADRNAVQQTVSVGSGAVATSSVTARVWQHDGQAVHHIIDPRTGRPARAVWQTVSVAAPNCVAANIATTACLVAGHRAVASLTRWQLPARLVALNGNVVTMGGWPQEAAAA